MGLSPQTKIPGYVIADHCCAAFQTLKSLRFRYRQLYRDL